MTPVAWLVVPTRVRAAPYSTTERPGPSTEALAVIVPLVPASDGDRVLMHAALDRLAALDGPISSTAA